MPGCKACNDAWDAIFAGHLTNVFGLPLSKAIAQEHENLMLQIRSSQAYLDEASAKLRAAQERILFLTSRLEQMEANGVSAMESNGARTVLASTVVQATPIAPQDQAWTNVGTSLVATREHILLAMKTLHESAKDTVWLTEHETVFERLATIYGYAGGEAATLAQMWPEYYA